MHNESPQLDDAGLPEMIGQFILDRGAGAIPQSWSSSDLGPWRLSHHSSLPVHTIRASGGTPVGWLLGLAIGSEDRIIEEDWLLPSDVSDPDTGSHIESELRAMSGRFVAIYLASEGRVYLDGCGSLALVYSPDLERVASSPNLIPRSESCRENEPLIRALGLPQSDAWYPFGLTPRHGIERLLPNHYLDLTRWTVHRHWPPSDMAIGTGEPAGCVAAIATLIERSIAAVTRVYPAQMPLTAGRDSRMLLACARPYLSRIRCYTTSLPDATAQLDCKVARTLAHRHGFQYDVGHWKEAAESELRTWLDRTGTCVAGRVWRGVQTEEQLDPARINLSGLAGEVGRAYYWRVSDTQTSPLSWSALLERIRIPPVEEIGIRAQRWLDTVPLRDTLAILDLLYLEQRLGCWAGPSQYGSVRSRFIVLPFNATRIFQLMLALPHEYRRENRLAEELIRARWPELLDLPFNEPIGWRRWLWKVRRAARRWRGLIGTK
jgi:hypothetical protein